MSKKQKIALYVAEAVSRVVIYGPIGVACVVFLGWITVPGLALAASEPWLNMGVAKAGIWLDSPKRWQPIRWVMSKAVDPLLNKAAGGQPWVKHLAKLVPGAIVGALFPIPAVLQHSIVHNLLNSLVGGWAFNWAWMGVMGAVMFTGLPLATKLLTGGLTNVFNGMASGFNSLSIKLEKQKGFAWLAKGLDKLSQGLSGLSDLHNIHVVGKVQQNRQALRHAIADMRARENAPKVTTARPTVDAGVTPTVVTPADKELPGRRVSLRPVSVPGASPIPTLAAPKPSVSVRPVDNSGGVAL